MGFKTFGFAGGREDILEPEADIMGAEIEWLGAERYNDDRQLQKPLRRGADGPDLREPEGPGGKPDPLAAAAHIRETFAPDGDERRGDRRADRGGHTFGKPTARPTRPSTVGPEPEGPPSRSKGSAGRTVQKRQGARHDHQRPRRRVDLEPGEVGQRLLR